MTKGDLAALMCLAHCLGLTMAAVGRILRVHEVDIDVCTLDEAILCLANHAKFVSVGMDSLAKDVVGLFEEV